MISEIKFDDYVQGKLCVCKLTKVSGSGGQGRYHFYVNNYYWGMIHHTSRGWEAHINHLTEDQKNVLVKMIIENEAQ